MKIKKKIIIATITGVSTILAAVITVIFNNSPDSPSGVYVCEGGILIVDNDNTSIVITNPETQKQNCGQIDLNNTYNPNEYEFVKVEYSLEGDKMIEHPIYQMRNN